MFHFPEQYRVDSTYCEHKFMVGKRLVATAAIGEGWEHVVVARPKNQPITPTWREMCLVKDLFWDKEDVVVQYHPRESEYVNEHPYALHLWRPTNQTIPTPPMELV